MVIKRFFKHAGMGMLALIMCVLLLPGNNADAGEIQYNGETQEDAEGIYADAADMNADTKEIQYNGETQEDTEGMYTDPADMYGDITDMFAETAESGNADQEEPTDFSEMVTDAEEVLPAFQEEYPGEEAELYHINGFDYVKLEGIDFSSMRIIVGTEDESIFVDDSVIVASYNGLYLLQFPDKQTAIKAYAYYLEKADLVEADTDISIADEKDPSGEYSVNVMEEGETPFDELESAVISGSYDIALIDTGADNAEGAVSMTGDSANDDNGHGNRMYACIKEQNPEAKVLSIKALGNDGKGDVSAVYAAIQLAIKNNVKVISLSISSLASKDSMLIEDAINEATEKGIIVVGAAGNNGKDAKYYIPGRIFSAVIAGAADKSGIRLGLSNYGDTVDYNIVAESTSEAAAKLSGWLSKNSLKEIKNVLNKGLIYSTAYDGSGREFSYGKPGIYYKLEDEGDNLFHTSANIKVNRYNGSNMFLFQTTLNGLTGPAYCISWGYNSPDGDTYSGIAKQGTKNALGYIMRNGYPAKMYGMNAINAQYITALAVWNYLGTSISELKSQLGDSVPNSCFTQAAIIASNAKTKASNADADYVDFWAPSDSSLQLMITPRTGSLKFNKQKGTNPVPAAVYRVYKEDKATVVGWFITTGDGAGRRVIRVKPGQITSWTDATAEYTSSRTEGKFGRQITLASGGNPYAFGRSSPKQDLWYVSSGSDTMTLFAGQYYIQELLTPINGKYLMNTNYYSAVVNPDGTATVSASDKEITGISLKKTHEGNENYNLIGALYAVYTNPDCTANLKDPQGNNIFFVTDQYGVGHVAKQVNLNTLDVGTYASDPGKYWEIGKKDANGNEKNSGLVYLRYCNTGGAACDDPSEWRGAYYERVFATDLASANNLVASMVSGTSKYYIKERQAPYWGRYFIDESTIVGDGGTAGVDITVTDDLKPISLSLKKDKEPSDSAPSLKGALYGVYDTYLNEKNQVQDPVCYFITGDNGTGYKAEESNTKSGSYSVSYNGKWYNTSWTETIIKIEDTTANKDGRTVFYKELVSPDGYKLNTRVKEYSGKAKETVAAKDTDGLKIQDKVLLPETGSDDIFKAVGTGAGILLISLIALFILRKRGGGPKGGNGYSGNSGRLKRLLAGFIAALFLTLPFVIASPVLAGEIISGEEVTAREKERYNTELTDDLKEQEEQATGLITIVPSDGTVHEYRAYPLLYGKAIEEGMLWNMYYPDTVSPSLIESLGLPEGERAATDLAHFLSEGIENDEDGRFAVKVAKAVLDEKEMEPVGKLLSGTEGSLSEGYYVILSDDGQPLLVLIGNKWPVVINEKSSVPKLDKEIGEVDPEGKVTFGKAADSGLGKIVPYKITGTLPLNYNVFDEYTYNFRDEYDECLVIDRKSVNIILEDGKGTKIKDITDFADIDIAKSTMDIRFKNLKKAFEKAEPDQVIVVYYDVMIDDAAKIGSVSNDNNARIEYTRSPTCKQLKESVPVKCRLYTWELDLLKVSAETGKALEGAEFTIQDEKERYLNSDGTISEKKEKASVWTADKTGYFKLFRIDSGKYTVTETKAPKGYNIIKPFVITITADYQDADKVTLKAESDSSNTTVTKADSGKGISEVTVRDALIPKTGDTPAIIFYIAMLFLSLMCITAITVYLKKKTEDR